jgi:class 3 adenylate cyclase
MPMYMDIHELKGVTAADLAKAHAADVHVQGKHGVEYHKYWFNEAQGKIFCLCSAPSAEAAAIVHRQAHGLEASKIIEVAPEIADGFMGGCEVNAAGAALVPGSSANERDPGIRTILFTDIVGSTAMTQRLGDHAAMEVLELHDRCVRAALQRMAGREVKHLGDGIMAAFASAQLAMRCASFIHSELSAAHVAGEPVRVRVGAASGEPVERHGDFFGSTVQLAARLCAHAQPSRTLVSSSVVEQCREIRFEDVGEVTLKGFPQPVRAHAVVD